MELDNPFFTQENDIETAIREYWIIIDQYTINSDGSIDVDGNVKFPNYNSLNQLPFKFNKITGNFDISGLNLSTLWGSPSEVGEIFNCSHNQLTTLEFLPKKASLFIFDNTVKSLFTGGINSNFNDVVMIFRTSIFAESISKKLSEVEEHFPTIFKYQNYYDIWNDDKSLNEKNLKEFVEDLRDGLE